MVVIARQAMLLFLMFVGKHINSILFENSRHTLLLIDYDELMMMVFLSFSLIISAFSFRKFLFNFFSKDLQCYGNHYTQQ